MGGHVPAAGLGVLCVDRGDCTRVAGVWGRGSVCNCSSHLQITAGSKGKVRMFQAGCLNGIVCVYI